MSTSDPRQLGHRPGPLTRAIGLVRLSHPFPSLLDGAATAAIAYLAGAAAIDVLRLGAAMTALQLAIGSANDAADEVRDKGRPDKPIPAGLVTRRVAIGAAVAFAACGLVLSMASGLPTLGVAVLGLSVGLAYDLRFRGTALSWLPFAIGVPLLPVYAWLGATGGLAVEFAVLVPCAVLAGIALAVANALADLERDRAAGLDSVARALGPQRAWRIHVALLAAMSLGALGSLVALGAAAEGGAQPGAPPGAAVALLGVVVIAVGTVLVRRPATVERGWEVEAVGMAALAVGWVLAVGLAR